MGYYEALEAAGAKIIEFKEFGSWQGTWIAIIDYNNKRQVVEGYYGSCSGCDAFLAEFEFDDDEKSDYKERLARFGKEYIDNSDACMFNYHERLESAKKDAEWDTDSEDLVKWLEEHKKDIINE